MKKIKLLLYCCKTKPMLRIGKKPMTNQNRSRTYNANEYEYFTQYIVEEMYEANGKIVAECDFEVEEIINCGTSFMIMKYDDLQENYRYTNEIARCSCLDYNDLRSYLGTNNGYAIHIKNLHIFDEPKELDDFTTRTPVDYDSIICDSCTDFNSDCKKCRYSCDYQQVIKAPKNMMKVCEWDIEDKVLISIKSECLCKILNGEKSIEVRKKVLKEMLENE